MAVPDAPAPSLPRVTYDPQADAAYVHLARIGPGEAASQVYVEAVPGRADVVLDIGRDGTLLGMEVIGARAVLSPQLLASADPAG
jgi:uncharacterized protein YuzE